MCYHKSFFISILNETFSNYRVIVFIITWFSNKDVKQVVWSIIAGFHPLCKEDRGWSSVYCPKNRWVTFSPKKGGS